MLPDRDRLKLCERLWLKLAYMLADLLMLRDRL